MAIALDAATAGGNSSSGTTHTFSHTCSGSDRILFVQATGNNVSGNATDDITGITYNGVSMTYINKTFVAADRYRYLYYLVAPSTGANNVVITSSTSGGFKSGNAVSYTGAAQTGQPDSNAVNQATANTLTVTVTTTADNCWTVLAAGVGGANTDAGAGSTLRATSVGSTTFDSGAGKTPAGSTSMTIVPSDASSHPIMGVMASFAPAAIPETHSREAKYTLPTGITDLATLYTSGDLTNVATANGVRVDQAGAYYLIHQFKDTAVANTSFPTGTWIGQSTLAASASTIYLQVYNHNTASWTTIDSDNTTAANTDLTLTGTPTGTASHFYNGSNVSVWRVYQLNS